MERKSRQKTEIRKILSQNNFHPTIEEIHLILKKRVPGVGIATVYRNIDKMVRNGEIIRLEVPGQGARFDGNTEKHYHFRCEKCNSVEDVWLDIDINSYIKTVSPLKESIIRDHMIEFTGICAECQK
ncbi:MAG: transcriptional repressor [Spirochaetes bacterium]|nr:transcriptional repressor [Spirochaetota bacterium]MBN2770391.1 transcriptional repressor [Spirochaetota bacterium]HRX15543.1 transcriptional repressor [Spirochaetota bacterium]